MDPDALALSDIVLLGTAAAFLALPWFFLERFVKFYNRLYERLCGIHPHRRPWHYQWLSVKDIYRDLREVLPTLKGDVLDVGCLGKPYGVWLTGADSHVGIDVAPGRSVDYVIRPGERWPFEDGRFQSVLCTQVVQVVEDPFRMMAELHRVLVPGGVAVITIPFAYFDMSMRRSDGSLYRDYWRHSVHGAEILVSKGFEVVKVRRQGGIGSTLGVSFLSWIRIMAARTRVSEVLFAMMLPLWLLFSLAVNIGGWLLDFLDVTGAFYHNVLVIVRKGMDGPSPTDEGSSAVGRKDQVPAFTPSVSKGALI